MKHPIVINSSGYINNYNSSPDIWKNLISSFRKIFDAPLRSEAYYMTLQDYDDILKWSNEK